MKENLILLIVLTTQEIEDVTHLEPDDSIRISKAAALEAERDFYIERLNKLEGE